MPLDECPFDRIDQGQRLTVQRRPAPCVLGDVLPRLAIIAKRAFTRDWVVQPLEFHPPPPGLVDAAPGDHPSFLSGRRVVERCGLY